jgi:hypothetical protein
VALSKARAGSGRARECPVDSLEKPPRLMLHLSRDLIMADVCHVQVLVSSVDSTSQEGKRDVEGDRLLQVGPAAGL